MLLHLFGATTPAGEAFKKQLRDTHLGFLLFPYSRAGISCAKADFNNPDAFRPDGEPGAPGLWVSFAPVWLFASFMERLAQDHAERLEGLSGVIACSSSSAITKRFAANSFDRELVARLIAAEDLLLATCHSLGVPCRILRPTLIYGRVGPYVDRNLSRLIRLMRRLPVVLVPAHTGLRQPIHAKQLASVAFEFAHQLASGCWNYQTPDRIALGGDVELSYAEMLHVLQQALPGEDPARRCRVLQVPTRLFYAAASPLLLHSPKSFEAILRIGSNLSGFTPCHQVLNIQPQIFPVLPFL